MADALCMLFVSNYIMFFIIYTALYHTLYVSLTFYHPHHICMSFQQFPHINISIYNNPHHPTSYHILHSSITLYPRSLCYSLLYHVLHAHAITSLPPPTMLIPYASLYSSELNHVTASSLRHILFSEANETRLLFLAREECCGRSKHGVT